MTTLTILPSHQPVPRAAPATPVRVLRPVEAPGRQLVRARAGSRHADSSGPVTAPDRPCDLLRRRHSGDARPQPVSCDRSYELDLHGSRLTPRGRLVVVAAWLSLAAVAAFGILRPGPMADPAPSGTTTVVVQPGDTLWQLARAGDARADPRETIDAIVELNGLSSGADIHPGDVLLVPRAG